MNKNNLTEEERILSIEDALGDIKEKIRLSTLPKLDFIEDKSSLVPQNLVESICHTIGLVPEISEPDLVLPVINLLINDSIYRPLVLAVELAQYLPECFRPKLWEEIIQEWIVTWDSVMNNPDPHEIHNILENLLDILPSIYPYIMYEHTIEHIIKKWDHSLWDKIAPSLFGRYQEAFAILAINSSPEFSARLLEILQGLMRTNDLHGRAYGGLLPLLLDYQISYIARGAIGIHDLGQVKKVIPYWPPARVVKMWKMVLGEFSVDKDYVFGEYAMTITPYLPFSFVLDAWNSAIKMLSPKQHIYWDEICFLLIERLPTHDIPKAIRSIELLETENASWGFAEKLKMKLYSRLSEA